MAVPGKMGSFRIYGSGLIALRCVSEIHLGGCQEKALAGKRIWLVFPILVST